MTRQIIRPAQLDDVASICAIYNQGIASGLATFDTTPRSPEDVTRWLDATSTYPVIVVENNGQLLGFARLFEYRPRACYQGIAEFSIYLDETAKGKGLGAALLAELLVVAKIKGFHKVLSRIFTFNHASRALCNKQGFRQVGIYENHGQLNGKWLDVVIVECLLTRP